VHANVVALESRADSDRVGNVAGDVGDTVGGLCVSRDEDIEDGDGIIGPFDQLLDDPSTEETVSSGDETLCYGHGREGSKRKKSGRLEVGVESGG